ncbi:hypothetical protein LTI14_05215 [Nesterenkonia sp. YGD6]|uniref:hypothetical protein n=1 Tax=Nesterenkonia sp. YGD6 TaxID=2901231 RepID=UPI001F4CB81B|nr:hypothetical protein [Nesterenkonia sp. YGD6]MCH8562621.1 hypothetical protein [Nesterenkonia sp. YGD6]
MTGQPPHHAMSEASVSPEPTVSPEPFAGAERTAGLSSPRGQELTIEELESEIAESEALVQDLNQRLKETAEGAR